MTYLIYYKLEAFYTNWFDKENNYVDGMIVFNLVTHEYFDGSVWKEIKEDHL